MKKWEGQNSCWSHIFLVESLERISIAHGSLRKGLGKGKRNKALEKSFMDSWGEIEDNATSLVNNYNFDFLSIEDGKPQACVLQI